MMRKIMGLGKCRIRCGVWDKVGGGRCNLLVGDGMRNVYT